MKKVNGIYKITSKVDGKVYIGLSSDIKKRIICHQSKLRKNKHHNPILQNHYNKYGEGNYVYDIIDIIDTSDDMYSKEIFWIRTYMATNIKYGFNILKGGDGVLAGTKLSDETKKKIKDSIHKIKDTPEYRKSVSDGLRRLPELPNIRPVINVNTMVIYSSIKEVSVFTGMNYSGLQNKLRREANNINDTPYMFIDEYREYGIRANQKFKNNKRRVKNTKTGEIFKSMTEAAAKNGYSIGFLYKRLNGTHPNETDLKYINK